MTTGVTIKTEASTAPTPPQPAVPVITIRNLNLSYGDKQVLHDVSMEVFEKSITALIGPSGCGKSTLLRCLNRMNDLIEETRISGSILVKDQDIYAPGTDVIAVRRRIGMVFQKSNPFPKSIFENVVYGLRIVGTRNKTALHEACERSLRRAALWDEVKDRLSESALSLSGGQQQRLCIARAIAVEPEILLLDEPCSALDPIATAKIEDLMHELHQRYTIVLVTHNMQQAARVAHRTAFLYLGELVEYDETNVLFTRPSNPRTEEYITGRFG